MAHRRAGKTVASTLDAIDHALRCAKPDGRYGYIAPYYAQAKDVVWGYVKQYTWQIPGVQVNESELRVDLPTGARLRLYGADNYDRMRGIYLDGAIMDEPADQPPQAWREVIRPALADRKGWATFIGTPKGKNAFYDIYQNAIKDPEWFAMKLKASETGLIDQGELDALRGQMSANEYAREFECDFDAAIEGAYYAEGLAQAAKDGRIGNVTADPLLALRVYCDIGGPGAKADAFAMWVCQFVGREIRVLDYYEAQGQPLAEHVQWLRSNDYGKAEIFLPHDGLTESGPNIGSFESAFRDAGFSAMTLRNEGSGRVGAKTVRIEAVRRRLPMVWFNEAKTAAGRDALMAYHEKRDEKRGMGLGPEHDWASHGADAFGLLCVAYEEPRKASALDFSNLTRGMV
ncbi:MAG: terminase large subunit domain-containing protein [Beijerinckiaceae bacterium]